MENLNRLYEEAYRLSEKRLQVQLTAALAADARAMAFAGICLAAAAVLGGLAKDAANPILLLSGAFLLGLAAFVAGFSARPIDFHMPGAKFSDLEDDFANDEDYYLVIKQLGGFADRRSVQNDQKLSLNSRLFHFALILAVIGVGVAVVPQLLDAFAADC
ncbi:hypothetical protein K3728_17680 [Rhodobacteraceae bacterium M385]|nr:hypothetical protein K3728_17680 [Rhodobacteraceae bacterium M385]